MVRRWTSPDINLFATSALILRFFAGGDAPQAEALDALAQPWNYRLAYAFPPPFSSRRSEDRGLHRRLPPSE